MHSSPCGGWELGSCRLPAVHWTRGCHLFLLSTPGHWWHLNLKHTHHTCVWKGKLGEDAGEVTSQDFQDDLKVWAQVQVRSYLGQPSWYVSGDTGSAHPHPWHSCSWHDNRTTSICGSEGFGAACLHESSLLPALTGGGGYTLQAPAPPLGSSVEGHVLH